MCGLGWQRDHAEKLLTGGALNSLSGDHATHILPGGKTVPDRHGRILPVVALKQLVLHSLDRRQDRRRIGSGFPPSCAH